MLLEINNVSKYFGGVNAISDLSLSLNSSEIVGLIGPNGAGKSTLFNLITGVYTPDSGKIYFTGNNITGLKPSRIIYSGICRTFQNIRLFANMTVWENVMVGRHCRTKSELLAALLRTPEFNREEKEIQIQAQKVMQFVGLIDKGNEVAKNLSYGNQRKLEIARALATEPQLLLLDEPTAGMNHQESDTLMNLIQRIREQGITIMVIEHQMKVVMGISDRVIVLDYGTKIAEGKPQEIQLNPKVIDAYLGK